MAKTRTKTPPDVAPTPPPPVPFPEAPARTRPSELRYVSVDDIEVNDWNPQDQSQATFVRLKDEIKDVGFLDPLELVPLANGRFRILGGEHRWMAAKVAASELEKEGKRPQADALEELPAIILTDSKWQDEDLQKFTTVRLNTIRGKLDPEKFLKLYEELAQKYGAESMQTMMGYVDGKGFQKLLGEMKKGMKKALPKEMQKEFDTQAKDARTVEDLQRIVQELFSNHGDTLAMSFMVFTYGHQEHVYVQMSRKMRRSMEKIVEYCKLTQTDINDFMGPVIEAAGAKAISQLGSKDAPQ